ncbi:MAG: SurA N-terminal domain-containing protein [Caulobacter sp.]|nr:SurA N-terminal domain-containing protein [Caulobacter sp.]
MLAALKKFMKSWFAAGILGLLIVCMAFLGFGKFDPFSAQIGTWVIKAGNREVDGQEFKNAFERAKSQLEQQYQQKITNEVALQNGFDRQVLEELAQNEALSALLARLGLKASDSLIEEEMKAQLMQVPGLFDDITGKLNQGDFLRLLSDNNLTEAEFRKSIADGIVRQQFAGSLTAGLKAPRIYAALQGAYLLEQRDLTYFVVTPASVGKIEPPTEKEMQDFMKENSARLMRPEFRQISVVRFNSDEYIKDMKADPAEVEKRFNFRKDSLSAPETRSIVQISVKSEKAAAEAADKLKKGEDPAVVAKAAGVEPILYDDKPRSAMFDKVIGDAAFSLPEGGVSGPLKGELGYAVVKVTGITPGHAATLEDHRAEIEKDVIAAAANNKAYNQAQAYDDAHSQGASFAEAAAKAGVEVVTIGPVSAQGIGIDGTPVKGLSKELLDTAFATQAGQESQLVEISAGDQFAVRVDKVIAPALPPLSEIRGDLTKLLMGRKQAKMMQDRAEALSARVRKGESMEAVAASAGYKLVKLDKMTRAGAQDHEALGREVLSATLDGSQGQVFNAGLPKEGLMVGRISAVRSGSVSDVAQMTEQQRQNFTQSIFGDVVTSIQDYAKGKVTVKTNRDRALTALGVDPKDYAEKPVEAETGDAKKDAKGK